MHSVKNEIMGKQINDVVDYLNYIEILNQEYSATPLLSNPINSQFLFRGMENSSYSLLPSVFRKVKIKQSGGKIENYKYLALNEETDILKNFIQEASAYIYNLNSISQKFVRWIELAQHYGVPTRLLDWSNNPLVALYFACESNSQEEAIVWILHRGNYVKYISKEANYVNNKKKIEELIEELLSESDAEKQETIMPKLPFIYTPYYFDNRMSAQGSWFMVWGTKKDALENMVEDTYYMNLPDKERNTHVYGQEQEENFLFRFLISKSNKQSIMRQLDHIGINAKTLFPGLDGIGKYIERKYRFD